MNYVVDTNVMLRAVQSKHAMQRVAYMAIATLRGQGERLCLTSQNVIESWAVATRPLSYNGLGMTVEQAARQFGRIKRFFTVLPDSPAILTEWEGLVIQYRVIGKQAHDARIVAAMKAHGVTHLLTFNTDDFKRYAEITTVHPANVAAP
ncbi:MAG TPA: type II toxin-antitoxin system VapC family toxin [Blastocatellia bacterium]|nr:type II toxin-antitoxin system VapC family toxin [Blastocatellia bacterium]